MTLYVALYRATGRHDVQIHVEGSSDQRALQRAQRASHILPSGYALLTLTEKDTGRRVFPPKMEAQCESE